MDSLWTDIILSLQDKNPYCRKLLFELYHHHNELWERRFYELSFALYGRFFQEKLSPLLLAQYFEALNAIVDQVNTAEEKIELRQVINLGLQLKNFTQYSEDNFQLTNILLQINYLITLWHNTHHICKFCGHKLNLLTETVDR